MKLWPPKGEEAIQAAAKHWSSRSVGLSHSQWCWDGLTQIHTFSQHSHIKKLLGTSASLLGTSALLVVTRSYYIEATCFVGPPPNSGLQPKSDGLPAYRHFELALCEGLSSLLDSDEEGSDGN